MRALQRKHVGSINPAIKGSFLGGLVTKEGEIGGKLGGRVQCPNQAEEGDVQHLGPQAARPGRVKNSAQAFTFQKRPFSPTSCNLAINSFIYSCSHLAVYLQIHKRHLQTEN